MKAYKYFLMALLAVFAASSCDYLDKHEETEGLTLEDVFGDAINYENYVEWVVQNPIIRHHKAGTAPYGTWDDVSDNSMSTMRFANLSSLAAGGDYSKMITNDRCTGVNGTVWTKAWKHVRICNNGIKHIDMFPGDEAMRDKILGMCYFYRGFAYLEICRRWGGMPYFTEPLDLSDEDLDFVREDIQTTYLKAAEDFAQAAELLKPVIEESEWQHPTSVAALAMRSRALLYAASPLAATEGGVQREPLWEEAAKAADEAIKLAEDNGYALASQEDYYYIFKGARHDVYTKEVLLGRWYSITWGSDAYKQTIRPPGRLAGKYGPSTNQTFVDCFDMTNGYPITDPKSGYNPQDPYKGRGIRFEENILHNQSKPFGGRFTMNIWNDEEGKAAKGSQDLLYTSGELAEGYTTTGTYACKWMGKDWNKALQYIWPEIRMAELYLNFAEAAAEAGYGVNGKNNNSRYSPLEALNKIRNRVGIADLPVEYQTLERFKERVANERRVELCFEDHRFWDIKRLLIGTKIDQNMYRVHITKLAKGYDKSVYPTGFKYDYENGALVRRYVYEEKHHLFPIKREDTWIGPDFVQNPGW